MTDLKYNRPIAKGGLINMTYGLIGKTLVHSYSKEIQEALGRYI